ncbi:MAG: thioredoxin domain-containing protein [Candidatus Eisenbacteria bacterium]
MPNRLAKETSPYLLQHKDNPVDWYPWGEEALEEAKRTGKPIFLSIGYSACHWCHVMERESFEDPGTAAVLNDRFVSVKVDREERPDLDAIYMEAVQAMSGHGGWPMSVFLTPEGVPFFGGTYFPPEPRHGLPSFRRLAANVADAFRDRRDEVRANADRVRERISQTVVLSREEEIRGDIPEKGARNLATSFDPKNGGFGGAPKFPQPMNLDFLLRHWRRTNDEGAARMVQETLERMARGGIYDQIGGGFHRYSVDPFWLVPHFEKMLYDNALLARLYLHVYHASGRPLFRKVAEETLDYVMREMTDRSGGFYSTEDADSEGVEGKFFVWTPADVNAVLGEEEGNLFSLAYGITEEGNFEGKSIPNRLGHGDDELAARAGTPREDLLARLARCREKLYEVRETRVKPGLDHKVLTAWNGLIIAALADGARILGSREYLEAATRGAAFLEREMMREGRLLRTWKDGNASLAGYLEDYAYVADGLLALYQATFDPKWFRLAKGFADVMLDCFADTAEGGFFDTADDHEKLITRPKGVQDNATPSGNAMAARVLLQIHAYTGDDRYGAPARKAIASMQELMERHPAAFGQWLGALEFLLAPPREVALVGRPGGADTEAMVAAAFGQYNPNQVVAFGDPSEKDPAVPLLRGRHMVDDTASAYICTGQTCAAPITDPEKLAMELGR